MASLSYTAQIDLPILRDADPTAAELAAEIDHLVTEVRSGLDMLTRILDGVEQQIRIRSGIDTIDKAHDALLFGDTETALSLLCTSRCAGGVS